MSNIISLSGGKDSTALLLEMLERNEPVHSVVWFDTGWEFPEMPRHIEKLSKYTGIEIVTLHPKHPFDELLVRYKGWPTMFKRWCTAIKCDTIDVFNRKHKGTQCIGFAADEEKRTQSNRLKRATSTRFPLIEYGITEAEALCICMSHGFTWDGLYDVFDRVSCFCCPLGGKRDARKLRKYYPKLWARVLEMDSWLKPNRGYVGWETAHDLDEIFTNEDCQMHMWEDQPKKLRIASE